MAYVKKECFDRLAEFGFRDGGFNNYCLDPNFYKDGHPLNGMFTAVNVFVNKVDGQFWCGFINDEANKAFNALKDAGLFKEDEQ
jgi:hypothetical protein